MLLTLLQQRGVIPPPPVAATLNGGAPRWRSLGWGGQRPVRETLAEQLARRVDPIVPRAIAQVGTVPKAPAIKRAPPLFDTKSALAAAERVTIALRESERIRREQEEDDDVSALLMSAW